MQLTDGDRIRNLLAECCDLVDSGDLDGVGMLQPTEELPLQPVITGRYVDLFAPTGDGGWRFSRRAFGPSLTGNLSNHRESEL